MFEIPDVVWDFWLKDTRILSQEKWEKIVKVGKL